MYSSLAEGFYLKWCISKFVFCVNWCVHMFSLIYFHDGYVILYCNILGSNSILATDFHFILFLKHDAWGNSKGNKLAAECKRQACVSESLPSWERWCVSSSSIWQNSQSWPVTMRCDEFSAAFLGNLNLSWLSNYTTWVAAKKQYFTS